MLTRHRTPTHHRRRPRARSGVLLAAVAAVALAGCGEATSTTGVAERPGSSSPGCRTGTSLALVVPVHQGAPAPSVPQEWRCAVESALRAGVPVSVITAEGVPTMVLSGYVPTLDTVNPETLRVDLDNAQNQVIGAVTTATATSDGNDLLGALALAADQAAVHGPGGVILSLDPGVTDTGVLRTADAGMTLAAPEDVAVFTAEHEACPALQDTTVVLYAVGYTAPPQPPLSRRQVTNLAATWVAVAEACGATAQSVPLPRTGQGPETAHTMGLAEPEAAPTLAPPAPAECRVEIPDSEIGFLPDSAAFADDAAATAVVDQVAGRLAECRGTIEVLGMTSSAGTEDGRARVAGARAQRVRDLLAAALLVDGATIAVRAVGFDVAQGSVPDRIDGLLSPTLASANRKVVITVRPDTP